MALGTTPEECIIALGRALKGERERGEQFCVFAFDCMEDDMTLDPPPGDYTRDTLPMTSWDTPPRWNAAFYKVVGPDHTEKAILDDFGQWISDYSGTYGNPKALYVYSFLIPCLRDGDHGHCSDNIAATILGASDHYELKEVHIGWSNSDRDLDMASAIKVMIADLDDDGIDITLHSGVSIADRQPVTT